MKVSDFGLSRSGRCVCVTFPSQYPISSVHQFYTLVFVSTTFQLCFPIVFPFHLPGSTFCLFTFHHSFLTSPGHFPLSLHLVSPTSSLLAAAFSPHPPFCCVSKSANIFCNPDQHTLLKPMQSCNLWSFWAAHSFWAWSVLWRSKM